MTIRPEDGGKRTYATGADSCVGFQLTSAGARALWSWTEGGESHLSAADVASPAVVDLGDFDSSDRLGPLAGSGELSPTRTATRSRRWAAPTARRARRTRAGGGRIAAASGPTIEIVDPVDLRGRGHPSRGRRRHGVALDDGLVASLSQGSAGRIWLEWFRLSTGARLGKREVEGTTLPHLAIRSPWILYRSTHALRVLATGSGRTWTVWRPGKTQLGVRLLGRRSNGSRTTGIGLVCGPSTFRLATKLFVVRRIELRDEAAGLDALIVIDHDLFPCAAGGTRMLADVDTERCRAWPGR